MSSWWHDAFVVSTLITSLGGLITVIANAITGVRRGEMIKDMHTQMTTGTYKVLSPSKSGDSQK